MQAADGIKRKRSNVARNDGTRDASARYTQKLDAMKGFKLPQARKAELEKLRETRNAVKQDKLAQAKKRESAGAHAPADSEGTGFQQEFLCVYRKQLAQQHQS
jgi:hypothetical protein